ncbi:MAG: hypothetical protein ACXVBJ_06920 [Flavisolibacter sp.]
MSRILLSCLLLLFALASEGQLPNRSNLHVKKIATTRDSVLLDTASIIPNSFRIADVDTATYRIDFVKSVLYWKTKPSIDSVILRYRTFPFKLNAVTQRLSFDSVINNVYLKPFEFNKNNDDQKGLLDFGNIQANGSLGRELSFGNNQDAVVNSNFQLQLNGMLRDSIEIAAAITDNNLPIQPDGTTQQLNEFDQVYLQFKKHNWQLNFGDIDIRQNQMYFLNFYKRLRGFSFQTTNPISSKSQSTTLVSGSIAKGKFTRNIFDRTTTTNMEGNQGPYRLRGANNEFFFIVLANTERVYLDGELLQRGEDQDYIINYNTAEVTFMPKRMITKDSRIQIEFEYADRNYLNANLYLNQEFSINNKLKLRIGAFNNNDAKNSQINQTLDAKQRQFFYNVGDSVQSLYYPAITLDSFSRDKVLYEKVYVANGNQKDSFYRYSIDSSKARYNLSFSDLGEGNGNYVTDFNGANGKVYKYIAPVNGVKQGRYEPVMVLVAPKKQQLISLAADYQINENNVIKTEFAASNYDVNTFSPKNNGDHVGMAARVQYTNTVNLNAARKSALVSSFDYEHTQEKFKPLERLRFVEFSRDWGLPLQMNPATEDILRLSSQLKSSASSISYQFMNYQRSVTDHYKGFQNILQQTLNSRGWAMNNQLALTTFDGSTGKGKYFRPVFDLSRRFRQLSGMRLGFKYALENNEVKSPTSDSLSATSFSFDTYSAYLKSDESRKNKYGLSFFTRTDRYPLYKDMIRGDKSYNTNVEMQLLQNPHDQVLLSATYRVLKVNNKIVSQQKEDNTILGRTEYLVNEFKGLVTGSALYELGTGQEQQRDYAYIEVPAGQGEYTWIDYNGDGIPQLNEFETAIYRDQAKYIRIFTPTNVFVKANYTTLNYSLALNPKAVVKRQDAGSFSKFLGRFNLQTSMQKTKKNIAKGDFEFNPFKTNIMDTSLLTLNTSFLNSMSFNRYSSKWGVDVSNVQNSGKALLTYGYETRQQKDWTMKLRVNLSSAITFDVNGRKGLTALYTPSFANRNYQLDVYSTEPRISFVKGTVFRVQTSYRYENKKNDPIYGAEKSISNSLNIESKYNVLQNSSINARFTFNSIQYNGATNSTVSYIMLDGLLPGQNFLWYMDFTKRIFRNLELNFQYDGRKPANTRTIHTGRASLRALF